MAKLYHRHAILDRNVHCDRYLKTSKCNNNQSTKRKFVKHLKSFQSGFKEDLSGMLEQIFMKLLPFLIYM
jgi:hypothetical protein